MHGLSKISLLIRRVHGVERRRLPDWRRVRLHAVLVKPHDRHLQLPELHPQLLEQRSLALLDRQELGLYQRDPLQQALLHRVDCQDRVAERGLEVILQRRFVGTESPRIALKDARQLVVDLQHLVLHGLEPLRLVLAGGHDFRPGHAVELVLEQASESDAALLHQPMRRGLGAVHHE